MKRKDGLRVVPMPDRAQQNAATVIALNQALATELVCVARYKSHASRCSGFLGDLVRGHFMEHAEQEQRHADRVAERILGGEPEYDPAQVIAHAHVKFETSANVAEMVQQNLVAERIAIEKYRELILGIGNQDAPTRALLEGILADEEEHCQDMIELANDPALEKLSF